MNATGAIAQKQFLSCPITDTSGTILRRRDIAGFSLTENVYPQGLVLSPHCHAHGYLSFVLSGNYTEKYAERTCVCPEGSLRYLPPSELHENEFDARVRCLLVRIDPLTLTRLGDHAAVLSKPGEVLGLAAAWLANRMVREFHADDDVAPLAIEGVLLEVLAESARAIGEGTRSNAPSWLRRVRETLEDSYLLAPSLAELAGIAGVHPDTCRANFASTTSPRLASTSASGASSMLRICWPTPARRSLRSHCSADFPIRATSARCSRATPGLRRRSFATSPREVRPTTPRPAGLGSRLH